METRRSRVYLKFLRIRKSFANTITNLSQKSALHGFKYIGDQEISLCERLFFLTSFIAIFIYVVVLLTDIYATWESTPFIVGMKPSPILIHKYPFPAVTICNVNQARATKVANISKLKEFEGFIQLDGAAGVDWDPEDGYQANLPKLFYPRAAFGRVGQFFYQYPIFDFFYKILTGIGISMGLSIVVNAEIDDYYCTSRNGAGFKLLLHNPMEIHSLRENGLYVETGSEMNFRIAVDRSEASQDLRNLSIEKRQCVFKTEQKLKYFKTYSRRNCEIECLVEMTAKYCGCISYFLPRTWTYLPACGLNDSPCQQLIQTKCKDQCMQGCFDIFFNPSKFKIPLTSGGYMIGNRLLEKMNNSYLRENIAVIHFYYKFSDFAGSMRTSYGGVTEFLSKTGGLIGLLGLSVISVVELMYFLVLKPFIYLTNLFKKRSRNIRVLQINQPASQETVSTVLINYFET